MGCLPRGLGLPAEGPRSPPWGPGLPAEVPGGWGVRTALGHRRHCEARGGGKGRGINWEGDTLKD